MRRIFGVAVMVACAAVATAQEQPAPDLAKENAVLRQQIAQLQAPKPPQPTLKEIQDAYSAAIKDFSEKIGPGCKAAGGKWLITFNDQKVIPGCVGR